MKTSGTVLISDRNGRNSSGRKRIFIAAELSSGFIKEIAGCQELLKKHIYGARWIEPQNLHITLVPPWYENDLRSIIRSLENVQHPMVDLCFDRIVYGPPSSEKRMLWLSGQAPPGLLELRDKILSTLGIPLNEQDFILHVTLARFSTPIRNSGGEQIKNPRCWKEKIQSIALMQSYLSKTGSNYQIIERFNIHGMQ